VLPTWKTGRYNLGPLALVDQFVRLDDLLPGPLGLAPKFLSSRTGGCNSCLRTLRDKAALQLGQDASHLANSAAFCLSAFGSSVHTRAWPYFMLILGQPFGTRKP
jgi:hypothetical protein